MPVIIGVDESGKGDFFGPLVIAAFCAPDSALPVLERLGVKDSKKLTDSRMHAIDAELRERFPHVVRVFLPSEYNNLYQKIKNLNVLLAKGHAEVISQLAASTPVDRAISDKFGKTELIENELARLGCDIELHQEVRGEAIPQVAAASILARVRFVNEMAALSEQAGMELPKGASGIVDRAGRELVHMRGRDALGEFAKVHFKNFQRATALKLL
ncbi:MAG: ribonuclease HIII [Candidatus Zixiibacteriota bacterium]